ncbi:PREDICTED: uncharacterized protein LOC104715053 [Camelina sativa]|uniref:Uncharacterized protein LOC104715053 n=1 Tax=Camelina sativa TaxID=90675 RepID=A0ABM0TSX5_CAMSA|nr:PREDICTED: uncharacterized protein LOC104715053 [Camelina sativa]
MRMMLENESKIQKFIKKQRDDLEADRSVEPEFVVADMIHSDEDSRQEKKAIQETFVSSVSNECVSIATLLIVIQLGFGVLSFPLYKDVLACGTTCEIKRLKVLKLDSMAGEDVKTLMEGEEGKILATRKDDETGSSSSTEGGSSSIKCPMLNPSNNTVWSMKMKILLRVHKAWDVIEKGNIDETKNDLAIALIVQSIPESLTLQVGVLESAREIWEAIRSRHIGVDMVKEARLQTLMAEFDRLRMKGTEKIDEFVEKLSAISTKSAALGKELPEPMIVKKFMSSLPRKKFIHIVASLKQVLDLNKTSFENIVGRLKAYEEGIGEKEVDHEDDQGKLMFANTNSFGNYRGRGRGGRSSRGRGRGRFGFQPKDKEQDLSHITCFRCDKQGHYAPDCLDRLLKLQEAVEKKEEDTHIADELMMHEVVYLQEDKDVTGKVRFGDDSRVDIKGKGSIRFLLENGEKKALHNVYFIPDLKSNIMIVRTTRSKNRLYKVVVEVEGINCLQLVTAGESSTWHARLGHIDADTMKLMMSRDLLTDPYSPQQNGVVERRNRTLLGMTRSILKHMELPNFLWGEAVRHSTYLINRIATRSLVDKTPYEMLKGLKPNLDHLRTFRCIVYAKTESVGRKKLDDRSRVLVHLGTEPGSKAYHLLDPSNRRIIVSHDVRFDESRGWDWKRSETEEQGNSAGFSVNIGAFGNRGVHLLGQTQGEEENNNEIQGEEESELEHGLDKEVDGSELNGKGSIESQQSMIKACDDELASIEKNKTWNLVDLPSGVKPIVLKWVFKIKKNLDGSINKYKARLVAKGYVQQYGIDYDKVFAHVARMETIRLIIGHSASYGWEINHLDVKTAFLYGDLKEEVFVTQPEGFVVKGSESKVYKLNKALYGLKQAPRAWNAKLNMTLRRMGFQRCSKEPSLYYKKRRDELLVVAVYVDDLLVTGSDRSSIFDFKKRMAEQFEMSDLGLLTFYLGIEVKQLETGIIMKQERYALRILEETGMSECNPTHIPMDMNLKLSKSHDEMAVEEQKYRKVIGCLRYLIHTRPDLAYNVGVLSKYMQEPKESHGASLKQVLRYLRGTSSFGLFYKRASKVRLGEKHVEDLNEGSHKEKDSSEEKHLIQHEDSVRVNTLCQHQEVIGET